MIAVNASRGTTLAETVRVADGFWSRLRGLLFRSPIEEGEGLALVPCKAVHMWGMRYPVDVAFLDDRDRIVAIHPGLRPWRRTPFHGSARWALELPSGTLSETATAIGDEVVLDASSRPTHRPTPAS